MVKKITNKQHIRKSMERLGYKLGCWDKKLEIIPTNKLNIVLQALEQESTDVPIIIDNKRYMVEISTVDDEKDIGIMTLQDYIDLYGGYESEQDYVDRYGGYDDEE